MKNSSEISTDESLENSSTDYDRSNQFHLFGKKNLGNQTNFLRKFSEESDL